MQPDCPFDVPLRLNMGGDETIDSLGRLWLGDRPCALLPDSDPLMIRREPLGGTNAICNWCAAVPESLEKLGLDPTHPGDNHIFTTIRWDLGTDGIDDFRVDLPMPEGVYDVNLYFNECCCIARHFKIELQGEIVEEDVNYLLYDEEPALGKAGVLSFSDVEVDDLLSIGFLPCPECPGATDNNAIINAIEVLPAGDPPIGDEFLRGDADASGVTNITDGIFVLNFLFLGGPTPSCEDAADADDSGAINITDGIYVLNFLFLGGPNPPAPSPRCGPDPTADGVGCATAHSNCP